MKKMSTLESIMEKVESGNLNIRVSSEEKKEIIQMASDKKFLKFLVDQYSQSQDFRITAQNQARSLLQGYDESDQGHPMFIAKQLINASAQESLNKKYINIITDNIPVCYWMKQITGVGEMIAAYLYSAFDVSEGRYNTDFLSYAGLNDNNIPWLGKEIAAAVTAEAKKYQKEILDKTDALLSEIFGDKKNKILSDLKKVAKGADDLVVSYDDITEVISKHGINVWDVSDTISDNINDIWEYIQVSVYPNYCTDTLIQRAALLTKRKPYLIKKGTINGYNKKKNKTKYISVEDLTSFLAKPPYNKALKEKTFVIARSFVMNSKRGSLYGEIIAKRKEEELFKNERREYRDQAERILQTKNITDKATLETLRDGKLTLKHIDTRARRYGVKLFISHVYEAMYYDKFGKEPPKTYVIEHMGHHDYIAPEVDYHTIIDEFKARS